METAFVGPTDMTGSDVLHVDHADIADEFAEAWSAEIRARLVAYERGGVKLIDGESVFAKACKLTK